MQAIMTIAVAALASQAAAEPVRDFCADLTRLVAAAQGGGDFHAFEREAAAPPRLGFRKCFVAAAARPTWYCHQTMAPEELGLAPLADRTFACLPGATREPSHSDHEAIFTLPNVRILIREYGGPRAHVGRIASYRLEAMTK